jgi:hypothetical protein
VQNQRGCDYCREDSEGYRLAFGAFSIHNPFHNGEWEISTGHCKPRRIYFCPMCGRKLPQPPNLGNKQDHQLDECSPQTEEG